MNRTFLHYFFVILVLFAAYYFEMPLWGFVSSGDGTQYTLETLDAATKDVKRNTDGSYSIRANIIIDRRKAPDTLTIDAGTVLKFAAGVELRIKGVLVARGKAKHPIIFTIRNKKKSRLKYWNGIVFTSLNAPRKRRSPPKSILEYCHIEYVRNGITLERTSHVTLAHNTIVCENNGIFSKSSSNLTIEYNHISDANIAMSFRNSKAIVSHNKIEKCLTGIHGDASELFLSHNNIRLASVAAVSIWNGKGRSTKITDNIITTSEIGIYCKRGDIEIKDNTLERNTYGILSRSVGTSSTITKNTIRQSQLAAIALSDGAQARIQQNDIRDNHYGIDCHDSDATITGNDIVGGEYGIRLESSNSKIRKNTIAQNAKAGIGCWSSKTSSIIDNTITRSRSGIYCELSSPQIRNNIIRDSTHAGIVLALMSRPIIKNNRITGVTYGIVNRDNTVHPVLTDNHLQNAVDYYDGRSRIRLSEEGQGGKRVREQESEAMPRIESGKRAKGQEGKEDFGVQQSAKRIVAERIVAEREQMRDPKIRAENRGKKPGHPKPRRSKKQHSRMKVEDMVDKTRMSPTERIAAQFESGRKHFKAGDYQAALANYDAILKEFADSKKQKGVSRELANVYYHRGLTLYQLKEYGKSVKACEKALELKPTSEVKLHTQYILAMSYMQLSDAKAEKAFRDVLKMKPADAEGQQLLASSAFQLGRIAEARGDYKEAIRNYSDLYFFASKAMQKNKSFAAGRFNNPAQRAEALAAVAYCYLRLNDYSSARSWYKKLVDESTNDALLATGYLALGDISARDKKLAAAEQYYGSALQHADAAGWDAALCCETSFKLGEILRSQKKHARSQQAYQKALQSQSRVSWSADAAYGLGESYFNEKDYNNAIAAYQQAIAAYENSLEKLTDAELIARAKNRIAMAKLQMAEAYAAISGRGQRADPTAEYQQTLHAYQDARNTSLFLEDEALRSALYKDALYGVAKYSQQLGKQEQSVKAAESLAEVATSEQDAIGLLQAADLIFLESDYQKAAEIYERALLYFASKDMQKNKSDEFPSNAPEHPEQEAHAHARTAYCYFKMAEDDRYGFEHRDEYLRKAITHYNTLLSDQYAQNENIEKLAYNASYHKALAHKSLGEYDTAAKLFEEVIDDAIIRSADYCTPNVYQKASLLPLAEIYESQKNYDDTVRIYKTALGVLTTETENTLILQKLGDLSRQQNRYDDAIHYYQELITQYPSSEYVAPARYFIGLSYSSKPDVQSDDLRAAIEAYEAVIQNHPSSEYALDAYWNAASLYNQLGEQSQARALCQQILEQYGSSRENHAQEVVTSARNLLSNILLDQMNAGEMNTADMETLRTELERIAATPTTTQEERANAYFELGNLNIRSQDYQSALKEYNDAINESPSEELLAKLYYQKALAYHELKEHANVLTACLCFFASTAMRKNKSVQDVVKRNPTPEMAMHVQYLMGVSFIALEQPSEAEAAFIAARDLSDQLSSTADSSEIAQIAAQSRLHLGNLYSQQKRNEDALREYQQAVQNKSSEVQVAAYRGIAQIYEGEPEHSEQLVEIYGNILALSNDGALTAEALYKRGLRYVQSGQNESASVDFEQLMKQFANSQDADIHAMVADATFRMPNIHKNLGNLNAAIEKAKAAERIARQDGQSPLNPPFDKGGKGGLAQAQYQLASLYYSQAQTHQQNSKTYKQLAMEAHRWYNNAYENVAKKQNPDESLRALSNTASFQAGQLAYQSSKFAESIAPLKWFTTQFPDDSKTAAAWNYLAWAYYQLADTKRSGKERKQLFINAADAFELLSARSPILGMASRISDDERAAEWLYQAGQSTSQAGENDRAIAFYRRLAETYPKHNFADAALYAAANVLYLDKQYDDALKTYQELCSKYSESDWADESAYSIGTCYDALNQHDCALTAYHAVIEKFPNTPLAASSQANIAHYYFNNKEYAKALDEYKKLTKANFPGIDKKLPANARTWIKDTENMLAEPIYRKAVTVLKAAEGEKIPEEQRKTNAQNALTLLAQIVEKYPHSIYMDNATVSMGAAHEILEQWEEATSSYNIIIQRYQKSSPPKDIANLIAYAQERVKTIQTYLWQKKKFE